MINIVESVRIFAIDTTLKNNECTKVRLNNNFVLRSFKLNINSDPDLSPRYEKTWKWQSTWFCTIIFATDTSSKNDEFIMLWLNDSLALGSFELNINCYPDLLPHFIFELRAAYDGIRNNIFYLKSHY